MNEKTAKQKAPKRGIWKDPKRRKILSITVFVVGVMVLAIGIGCLAARLMRGSEMADGEYLVTTGSWKLEDSDKVEWDFTEIGKGKLTTNGHENDYDFQWALEDGKLLVDTDWLYKLEDEYDYLLDQQSGILTLKTDDKEYRFVAQ